jgi:hypothetical protein
MPAQHHRVRMAVLGRFFLLEGESSCVLLSKGGLGKAERRLTSGEVLPESDERISRSMRKTTPHHTTHTPHHTTKIM